MAVPLLAASVAAAALAFAAVPARAQSDDRPSATASTLENIPPSEPEWQPADGGGADSSNGQVLEVPQVVDPDVGNEQAEYGGPDNSGAQDPDAQASNADGSSAADDPPDQIGSIDDYESQQNEVAAPSVYLAPVPWRPPVIRPLGMSPPVGLNARIGGTMPGGMLPPGPIIIPPATRSYIPPTSPMLMPPRGSGAMPGGLWMHVHR